MPNTYTAITKKDGDWWIGWIEEVPGVNCQERTHEELVRSLEVTLEEAHSGTKRILQMDHQRIEVTIPPGVDTGSRVRIAEKGGRGIGGGPSGHLYLRISVLPNNAFERKGNDLYSEVPIDLYTAILGGEVSVRTLEGQAMLKIPPETQSGKRFRLKGLGMPELKNPKAKGDLYAEVKIVVPRELSKQEKELFTQLASLRSR